LSLKIYLYGADLEPLYEHVPKECLPAELGGTFPATCEEISGQYTCTNKYAHKQQKVSTVNVPQLYPGLIADCQSTGFDNWRQSVTCS
jgi:hypothetical protein